MALLKKYHKHLLLLAITFMTFIVQVKAQFEDDGGPGDFDPPPDNDVPLDSYQWIMLVLAIGYGLYIFNKHRRTKRETSQAVLPKTVVTA
jgi:hypothetical protein